MNNFAKVIVVDKDGNTEEIDQAVVINTKREGKLSVYAVNMDGKGFALAAYAMAVMVEDMGLTETFEEIVKNVTVTDIGGISQY